eukprot:1159959-Pelagomonas_calceolata.AAC.2
MKILALGVYKGLKSCLFSNSYTDTSLAVCSQGFNKAVRQDGEAMTPVIIMSSLKAGIQDKNTDAPNKMCVPPAVQGLPACKAYMMLCSKTVSGS